MASPIDIKFILSLQDQAGTAKMEDMISLVTRLKKELQTIRTLDISPKDKGIEKSVKSLKNAGLAVNDLNDVIKFLEANFSNLTKEMANTNKVNAELFKNVTNIEKFSKSLQKLHTEINALGDANGADELRSDIDKVRASLEAASKSGNFNSVASGINQLRLDLNGLKSTASTVEDALRFEAAAQPAENSIASLRTALTDLRSQLEGADLGEESFRDLSQQVTAAETQLKEAQAAARQFGTEVGSIGNIASELEVLNNKLEGTAASSDSFKDINEQIGAFKRELEDIKALASVFEATEDSLNGLNAELALAQNTLNNAQFNTDSFELAAESIGRVNRQIQNIRDQQAILESVDGSFNQLTARVTELQNKFNNATLGSPELTDLRNNLREAQRELSNFDVVDGSIEQISLQLKEVNDDLQRVSVTSADFDTLTRRAAELTTELRNAQDVLSGDSVAGLQRSLADLNAEFARANPTDANYRQLAEDLAYLERSAQQAQDASKRLKDEFSQAYPLDSVQNIQRELQRLGQIQDTIDVSTAFGRQEYVDVGRDIEAIQERLKGIKSEFDRLRTDESLSALTKRAQALNEELQTVERSSADFEDIAREAAEAAKELAIMQNEVRVLGTVTGSVESLNAQLAVLNEQVSGTQVGSEEFRDLATQIGAVTSELDAASTALNRLTSNDLDDIDVLQAKLQNLERIRDRGISVNGGTLDGDELRDVNSAIDLYSDNLRVAEGRQRDVKVEAENMRKELRRARQTFLSLNPGDAGYEQAIQNIRRLEAELRSLEKEQTKVKKSSKTLAESFANIGKNILLAFGANEVIQIVKEQLQQLVAVGREYTAQLSGVRAITGATADEFDRLNQKARELGRTTTFTATEAAKSAEILAVAGFNVQEILDAQTGVLELAQAGGVSLDTAADIAASTLRGFGLKATEIGDVNEVLTNSFTNFNLVLEDFFEANKLFAPVAKSIGLELEESAGLINALANAGFRGSIAGTALRALVVNLSKPSDKAAAAIKNLGIELKDADGNLRNIVELLGEFEGASLSSSVAARIFGKQVTAFNILTGVGAETIRDYAAQVGDIGTKIRGIKSAFDDSAITVREFRLAVGQATEGVNPLRKGIDGMREAIDAADITITEQAILLGAFSQSAIKASRDIYGLQASAENLANTEFVQNRVQKDFAKFVKFVGSRSTRAEFDKLGLSIENSLGNLVELPDLLGALESTLPSELNKIAKGFVLDDLNLTETPVGLVDLNGNPFDNAVVDDQISGLLNSLDRLADEGDAVTSATIDLALFGTTADIAAQRINNLEGDVKILNSAKQDLYLTIFEFLNPSLRELVGNAQNMVTAFNQGLQEHQSLSAAFLSSLGAGKGLIKVLTKLNTVVISLLKSLVLARVGAFALQKALIFRKGFLKVWSNLILTLQYTQLELKATAGAAAKAKVAFNGLKSALGFTVALTALTLVIEAVRRLAFETNEADEAAKKLDKTLEEFANNRIVTEKVFAGVSSRIGEALSDSDFKEAIRIFDNFKKSFDQKIGDETSRSIIRQIESIFNAMNNGDFTRVTEVDALLKDLFVVIATKDEVILKDEIEGKLAGDLNNLRLTEKRLLDAKKELLEDIEALNLQQNKQKELANDLVAKEQELQKELNETVGKRPDDDLADEINKAISAQERLNKTNEINSKRVSAQPSSNSFSPNLVDANISIADNPDEALPILITRLNNINELLLSINSATKDVNFQQEEYNKKLDKEISTGSLTGNASDKFSTILFKQENIDLETERFRVSFKEYITTLTKETSLGADDIREVADEIAAVTRLSRFNVLSTLDLDKKKSKEQISAQLEIIKANAVVLRKEASGVSDDIAAIYKKSDEQLKNIDTDISNKFGEFSIRNFETLSRKVKQGRNLLSTEFQASLKEEFIQNGQLDDVAYKAALDEQLEAIFGEASRSKIEAIIAILPTYKNQIETVTGNTVASLETLRKKSAEVFDENGLNLSTNLGKGSLVLDSERALEDYKQIVDQILEGRNRVSEKDKAREKEYTERLKQLILLANKELEVRAENRKQLLDDIEAANLAELATRREFAALSIQQQTALLQQIQDEYNKKRSNLLIKELTDLESITSKRTKARQRAVDNEINAINTQNASKLVALNASLDRELITIEEYEAERIRILNESTMRVAEVQSESFTNEIIADTLDAEIKERTRIRNLVLTNLSRQKDEELETLEEGSAEYLRAVQRFNNKRLLEERKYQADISDLRLFDFDLERGFRESLNNIEDVFSTELSRYEGLVRASAAIQSTLQDEIEDARNEKSVQTSVNNIDTLQKKLDAQVDLERSYSASSIRLIEETERAKFLLRTGVDQNVIDSYLEQVEVAEASLEQQRVTQSKLISNISSTAESAQVILESETLFRAFEIDKLAELEEKRIDIFKNASAKLADAYDGSLDILTLFVNEEERLYRNRNSNAQQSFDEGLTSFEEYQDKITASQALYFRTVEALNRTTLNNLIGNIGIDKTNELFAKALTDFRTTIDKTVGEFSETTNIGTKLELFTQKDIKFLVESIDATGDELGTSLSAILGNLKQIAEENPILFDPIADALIGSVDAVTTNVVSLYQQRSNDINEINTKSAETLLTATTEILDQDGTELFRGILDNTADLASEYDVLFGRISKEASSEVTDLINRLNAGKLKMEDFVVEIRALSQRQGDANIFDGITTEQEVQAIRTRIDNLVNILQTGTTDIDRQRQIQVLGEQEFIRQTAEVLDRRFENNERAFEEAKQAELESFNLKRTEIENTIALEEDRAAKINELRTQTSNAIIELESNLFNEQDKIVRARQVLVNSEASIRVNAIERQLTKLNAIQNQLDKDGQGVGVVDGIDLETVTNDYELLEAAVKKGEASILAVRIEANQETAALQDKFNDEYADSTGGALELAFMQAELIVAKIQELELEIATSGDKDGALAKKRDSAIKSLQNNLATSNKTFLENQTAAIKAQAAIQIQEQEKAIEQAEINYDRMLVDNTKAFRQLGEEAGHVLRLLESEQQLAVAKSAADVLTEQEKVTQKSLNSLRVTLAFNQLKIKEAVDNPTLKKALEEEQGRLIAKEKEYTQTQIEQGQERQRNEIAQKDATTRTEEEKLLIRKDALTATLDFANFVFDQITAAEIAASQRRIEQYNQEYDARVLLLENESEKKLAEIDALKTDAELETELARLQTIEGKREEFRKREEARLAKQIKEAEKLRDEQVAAEEARIQRITKVQEAAAAIQVAASQAVMLASIGEGLGKTLALGPPQNLILVPAFLALVASSIAAVQALAKPAAFYEQGGYVPEDQRIYAGQKAARGGVPYGGRLVGRRHSQGGIPIEAEGGEFIVNRQGYKLFPRLIEFINQQGRNKMKGSVYSTKVPEDLFLSRAHKNISSYVPKQPAVPKRLVGKAATGGQVVTSGLDNQTKKFDTMISLLEQVATNQQSMDVRFSHSAYEEFLEEFNTLQARIDV